MSGKKILLIFITVFILGLTVCFSGCSSKSQEDDWEDSTITDIQEYVDPNEATYVFGPELTSIIGKGMDIEIPENLTDIEGPFKNKDSIEFSNDNNTAKVVITADKDENGIVCSYKWTIEILDKSAGNEFTYCFDDSEEYKIVNAENYKSSEKGNGLYFLDSEGYEISTISEAAAHDANEKNVDSYYKIEGKNVIQIVSFDDNPKFPITIE